MVVAVTGGTGFVGNAVVQALVEAGHEVRALVRPGSEAKLKAKGVTPVGGSVESPEALAQLLDGADALVHLIGIIREFPSKGITFEKLHTQATKAVVEAAQQAGVKRYLHMSANGTESDATGGYFATKWAAEELVRASSLDWTIFRPSLIFGADDQFVNILAKFVRYSPVVPVIGDGDYRMQPVAVEDVACGFAAALDKPEAIGKVYHCGGPKSYSYNDLLDAIGAALGKGGVTKLHQPVVIMRLAALLLERFPAFPVTGTQIEMLLKGNVCDPAEWRDALGLELTTLEDGIRTYLKQ